ncbi:MAG: hypothetical protein ACRD3O_24590, partial [Terriglobia bacterium]
PHGRNQSSFRRARPATFDFCVLTFDLWLVNTRKSKLKRQKAKVRTIPFIGVAQRGKAATKCDRPSAGYQQVNRRCLCGLDPIPRKNLAKKTRFYGIAMQTRRGESAAFP